MPENFGRARSNAIVIPGRARSNAISIAAPGQGSLPEVLARREIDLQRERALREMFGGTRLVTKTSAQVKRAKDLASSARDTAKKVQQALGQVGLPTVDIDVNLPSLPNFSIPSLNLPGIDLPGIGLPDINLPSVRLPGIALPNIGVPRLSLPGIDLPDFNLPEVEFPELNLPGIDLPAIGLPDLKIPGINNVLALLMNLFDGLDLPDIAAELGLEFIAEWIGATLPVLGQIRSGAQAAVEWGKAAKKGYQIYKVEGQKKMLLPGDPRAAADAVKQLLQRQALQHTAKASIKTTHLVSSSAALALDAGALSGPLLSAGSALATLSLKVHAVAVQHREMRAGNRALASPEKLGAHIFQEAPTLGCYLLTCSNTSDVINILTSDIGRQGWNIQVEAMKRKIDPLLAEATRFIISSPYELEGLRMNKGTFAKKKSGLFGLF